MAANIMMQNLLDAHREFLNFNFDRDPKARALIAREQIKLFGQVSRTVTLAIIPVTIYMMVNLFLHASVPFIMAGQFGLAVAVYISARNFLRQDQQSSDMESYHAARRMIFMESIIITLAFNMSIAFPLAFGQIPFNVNSVILALGCIILGGFTYGSIPRAQTVFILTTTIFLAVSFYFAGGIVALQSVALLLFFAVAIDWIYRLYFFNFVKRHIYAARQKDSIETVKLLLNDYAEQSSDWLWETGEDKRIVRASARFALAAGTEIGNLNGAHLADLFIESTERQALLKLIEQEAPIRNLELPIAVDGEVRWWKISGRLMKSSGSTKALRGVATDVTMAKQATDQIAHLAHFDGLTNLPNRSLFIETLQRSLARLKEDQSLAVLYLDLDHFKLINDTMGHSVGDQVLQEVGNRLEAAVGAGDMVARLSGDEFVICLNNIDHPEDALRTASTIFEGLAKPLMIDGHMIASGISLGIALSTGPSDTAEGLLQNADIALYKSKKNGRGRSTIFESHMLHAVQNRRSIEMDLRAALKQDEFELHYQPLFDIATKSLIGYEALIRWNHPTKGMIMPNDFIPIAETTGLIIQIGEWVLRTALLELRNWPDHLSVSVNLSPAQMHSANLLPTIVHALASAQVEPCRLELEITETVIMAGDQSNIDLLTKIHSLGVHIALDDFGTGYSSLSYLRSFPFDKIKIDRCFVDEVDSRKDCQAIIRAVTGLASSLGMVTTAEGIETDDQLAQLRSAGCTQVQGYLFSKAIPASEIAGRLVNVQPTMPGLGHIDKLKPAYRLGRKKRRAS